MWIVVTDVVTVVFTDVVPDPVTDVVTDVVKDARAGALPRYMYKQGRYTEGHN